MGGSRHPYPCVPLCTPVYPCVCSWTAVLGYSLEVSVLILCLSFLECFKVVAMYLWQILIVINQYVNVVLSWVYLKVCQMRTSFHYANGTVLLSQHMGPLLILPADGGVWKTVNTEQSTSKENTVWGYNDYRLKLKSSRKDMIARYVDLCLFYTILDGTLDMTRT